MTANTTIRTAIVGVGNCASSLVQAVAAARSATLDDAGVPHPLVGPYSVGDLRFVAAFDVDRRKIGFDLHEAILAEPNCTTSYVAVPSVGAKVQCGILADGVSPQLESVVSIELASQRVSVKQITDELRSSGAEVVVSYLPTGSGEASALYAEAACAANAAFVNCNPELIANDQRWQAQFLAAGVPLLGDDIRSQLGATRVHRALLELCRSVGAVTGRTYQLNFGGNTDFLNMYEPSRAVTKKHSKEGALGELVDTETQLSAGPSGYVHFLADQKVAYIRLEGKLLLGMPFSLETRLQVEDSPNSAGVALDAIRAAKVAADRGIGGVISDPCSYLFKAPPVQRDDREALRRFVQFADQELGSQ